MRYALLGATGATGSAILRCLLAEPPARLKLNVMVRSRSKLLQSFPDLQRNARFPVNIIQGSGTDRDALRLCLKDSDVIFMCIATNVSVPGMSVSYDTANAVIETLKSLRKEEHGDDVPANWKAPTILQLRTAALSPELGGYFRTFGHCFLTFCLHHNIANMKRASSLYESASKETPGLYDYIFVDPPALHGAHGTQRTGYKLLTTQVPNGTERHSLSLHYADLGAAFCELAERRPPQFSGKCARVIATGKVTKTWGTLLWYVMHSIKGSVFGQKAGPTCSDIIPSIRHHKTQ